MSAPCRHKQSGFTLVEVLVAMFIFSLISVGTMSALTNSLQGRVQIETRLEMLAELETARSLIKSDMSNLILRPSRDAYGNKDLYLLSGGVDTLLDFTRAGRDNPGGLQRRGDLQRVAYVFEDGTLLRRALPHENPSAADTVYDRVLLDNVLTADIEFITGDQAVTYLAIPPTGSKGDLPDMIRLTINIDGEGELVQYFEVGL